MKDNHDKYILLYMILQIIYNYKLYLFALFIELLIAGTIFAPLNVNTNSISTLSVVVQCCMRIMVCFWDISLVPANTANRLIEK